MIKQRIKKMQKIFSQANFCKNNIKKCSELKYLTNKHELTFYKKKNF